nr:hypothetical protein [Tanacetum cinerariifolium]
MVSAAVLDEGNKEVKCKDHKIEVITDLVREHCNQFTCDAILEGDSFRDLLCLRNDSNGARDIWVSSDM